MLYEALLGHPLFRRVNEIATIHAILEDNLPPLDGVPPDLVAALQRATNKDPNQRFRDAREFAIALSGDAGASRLGAGPEDLVAYMAELFPVRAIRWKHLLAAPAARFPFESSLQGEAEAEAEVEVDGGLQTVPVERLSDSYLPTNPCTPTSWSLTRKRIPARRPPEPARARPGPSRTSRSDRPLATSATSRPPSQRTMAVVGSIATVALLIAIFAAATRSRDKGSPDVCSGAQASLEPARASSALSLGIGPVTLAPMVPVFPRGTALMGRGRAAGRKEGSRLARRIPLPEGRSGPGPSR
jgi:hypothetical protein